MPERVRCNAHSQRHERVGCGRLGGGALLVAALLSTMLMCETSYKNR